MLAGEIPGNHPLRRHSHWKGAGLASGALLVALGASACSSRGGAPAPVTKQGHDVLDLWRILLGSAMAVGALVVGLILWSVVRYRRPKEAGAGGLPTPTPATGPPPVFYTGTPPVLRAVLF